MLDAMGDPTFELGSVASARYRDHDGNIIELTQRS